MCLCLHCTHSVPPNRIELGFTLNISLEAHFPKRGEFLNMKGIISGLEYRLLSSILLAIVFDTAK